MKLLYCSKCNHVFSLGRNLRTCDCGLVKGKYIDAVNAEVNGEGFSLAIGNGSLWNAMVNAGRLSPKMEQNDRQRFLDEAKIEFAWVRPHEGPGNPHTKINKDVK